METNAKEGEGKLNCSRRQDDPTSGTLDEHPTDIDITLKHCLNSTSQPQAAQNTDMAASSAPTAPTRDVENDMDFDLDNLACIYEDEESENTTTTTTAAAAFKKSPPPPVILMHDGGGTSFGYHCLEPLTRRSDGRQRALWGLQNPRFGDGSAPGWWGGGVPAMARHYLGLMDRKMPRGGDVILGGKCFSLCC